MFSNYACYAVVQQYWCQSVGFSVRQWMNLLWCLIRRRLGTNEKFFMVYGLMRNYIQLYAIWGEIMLQQLAACAWDFRFICCESWVKKIEKIIEKLTARQPATGVLWRHLTSHAKQLRISEIFLFSIYRSWSSSWDLRFM